jgi:hypothetical protein
MQTNSLNHWKERLTFHVLVSLTQNYLKFLLRLICEGDQGMGILVHCISGWDRTPLFISLLRLLLWAEGHIHETLDPSEMLYLTVGYDWMLFRHQAIDRRVRGEDIFYFCFYFLDYVMDDEFTIERISKLSLEANKASDPPQQCKQLSPSPNAVFSASPAKDCPDYSPRDRSDSFTELCCSSHLEAKATPVTIPSRNRSDSVSGLGCLLLFLVVLPFFRFRS